MSKIQIGYGSDTRPKGRPKGYGGVNQGKVKYNGGFNFAPTVDFTNISDERWLEIFGKESMPKWKRELIEKGESLD